MYSPGDDEQRQELPVDIISGPLAQVCGVIGFEGDELAGGLVGPGRGVREGGIGEAIVEAVGGMLRREKRGIDVIEDVGVETLERDIHCGGSQSQREAERGRFADRGERAGLGVVVVVVARREQWRLLWLVKSMRVMATRRDQEETKRRGDEEKRKSGSWRFAEILKGI